MVGYILRAEEIIWHYEFGIDSGIPKCCIKFWLEEFSPLLHENKEIILYYHNQIEKSDKDFQYIPCPKCLESGNCKEIILCESKEEFPYVQPIYCRKEWLNRNF